MIIKISNLKDGVHEYSFDESIDTINLSEPFYGNFQLLAVLKKSHNQIILDAEITLRAKFECDRCTALFDDIIKTNYQMVYLFGQEAVESDSVNVTYLPLETVNINLKDDVRDFALLSIPMKKLCMEACKGLCSKCGKDLNKEDCSCTGEQIDERWLPLMELKNKINNN
jgi:uncharacterized protein